MMNSPQNLSTALRAQETRAGAVSLEYWFLMKRGEGQGRAVLRTFFETPQILPSDWPSAHGTVLAAAAEITLY
jgi:hypothetical protein